MEELRENNISFQPLAPFEIDSLYLKIRHKFITNKNDDLIKYKVQVHVFYFKKAYLIDTELSLDRKVSVNEWNSDDPALSWSFGEELATLRLRESKCKTYIRNSNNISLSSCVNVYGANILLELTKYLTELTRFWSIVYEYNEFFSRFT